MRIALFTLEALANARAVRRFVAEHADEIAVVALSDPHRPSTGGLTGQILRHVMRSGTGFLPYLGVNFGLPDLVAAVAPAPAASPGGDKAAATPLKLLCRRLGLPCVTVASAAGAAVGDLMRRHGADLIVSFHFDQIFDADALATAPLGGVNVHPSLLPHHRGPVPTLHALLEPAPRFGVTVHRLAAAVDAGAILAQQAVTLPADVTASRAAVLLHEAGRPLLDGVLRRVREDGRLPEGRTVPVLPYCGFPSRAQLRDLKRLGRKLVDGRDLREALGLTRPEPG
ncbi:MAG: formyltransferase family protein [Methylobacterium frigidaeris]